MYRAVGPRDGFVDRDLYSARIHDSPRSEESVEGQGRILVSF